MIDKLQARENNTAQKDEEIKRKREKEDKNRR